MPKKFTFILRRPQSMFDNGVLIEVEPNLIYVANRIVAETYKEGLRLAREEVFEADLKDFGFRTMKGVHVASYQMLIAFKGHLDPLMFSFQPGAQV